MCGVGLWPGHNSVVSDLRDLLIRSLWMLIHGTIRSSCLAAGWSCPLVGRARCRSPLIMHGKWLGAAYTQGWQRAKDLLPRRCCGW
jgi:hypothetical protein